MSGQDSRLSAVQTELLFLNAPRHDQPVLILEIDIIISRIPPTCLIQSLTHVYTVRYEGSHRNRTRDINRFAVSLGLVYQRRPIRKEEDLTEPGSLSEARIMMN